MSRGGPRSFRTIKVDAELYLQLKRAKRDKESFGGVIRRLMAWSGSLDNKKGRSDEELRALARIARHAWDRRIASGEIKPLGPPPG